MQMTVCNSSNRALTGATSGEIAMQMRMQTPAFGPLDGSDVASIVQAVQGWISSVHGTLAIQESSDNLFKRTEQTNKREPESASASAPQTNDIKTRVAACPAVPPSIVQYLQELTYSPEFQFQPSCHYSG
jgi:hypothetical protein